MSHPVAKGRLWEYLQKYAENMIVVVNADSLRSEGVKISRRLSWERTAKDFVWQMFSNPDLTALKNCSYLIVRFGVDGAILYKRNRGIVESRLFYDPGIEEDGFCDIYPGMMLGIGSAFVAALTATINNNGFNGVEEGIKNGLLSSRRLWQYGFGSDISELDYRKSDIFSPVDQDDSVISDIIIPDVTAVDTSDPNYWCILNDRTQTSLEDVAYNYVIYGDDSVLKLIPTAKFRDLVTIDRSEIESYRSIRNLIREFLNSEKPSNPLSIAVFGKPGSGKSFGVTEVAESTAPGKLKRIEFNMSQFRAHDDLISAFHKVRDISLSGNIPLVFFDEFDSDYNGNLGWLKYFLAPMQDGKFKEGETIHPIGKSIFVFAGGTCSTFAEFSREKCNTAKPSDPENNMKIFKDAKGPDFVSRLRGFVNIKGPDGEMNDDKLFMIRRALLLRSILLRMAKHLFDKTGKLSINPGILRAFVKIPEFKHGVRSMTAIVEMSMLSGRKSFEQASLPPPEQLELHVDADMFNRLVMYDVILGSAREEIAKAIHEKYLKDQKSKGIKKKPALVPWNKLSDEFKESNRNQADQIPAKLKSVRCGFMPVKKGQKPKPFEFTKDEIEIMSEMEHKRWNNEKLLAGWSYGKKRNDKKKIHDCLVDWGKLPNKIKDYDRNAVIAIPALLAKAGFEIYRMK